MQRDDTQVFDEPLYASYLTTTGQDRPYRSLVLQAQPSDGEGHRNQGLKEGGGEVLCKTAGASASQDRLCRSLMLQARPSDRLVAWGRGCQCCQRERLAAARDDAGVITASLEALPVEVLTVLSCHISSLRKLSGSIVITLQL